MAQVNTVSLANNWQYTTIRYQQIEFAYGERQGASGGSGSCGTPNERNRRSNHGDLDATAYRGAAVIHLAVVVNSKGNEFNQI